MVRSGTLLFESLIDAIKRKSIGEVLSSDVSYLMNNFNSLPVTSNSSSLPLPFNGKTRKQIQGKLKHLM